MTLPPEKIGDQGQRFDILATGYPADGPTVIGYAGSWSGAAQMAIAILDAPGCSRVAVRDRHDGMREVVVYAKTVNP